MSNGSKIVASLLDKVQEAFASNALPSESDAYIQHLNGTLDLNSSTQSRVYGHSPKNLINAVRSSVLELSNQPGSSVQTWWNPFTAILFDLLEQTIIDADSVESISSRCGSLRLEDSTNDINCHQGGLTSFSQIKGMSKPLTPAKKRVKNVVSKTSKKVATEQPQSDIPVKLTQFQEVDLRSSFEGPWFPNQRHVKCTLSECDFCEQLWHSLPLSRCTDIKSHVKGVLCSPLGWSAHVYPTTWLAAKKDHDAKVQFPGLSAYAAKQHPPEPFAQSPSTSASNKRRPDSPSYSEILSMAGSSPKTPRICKDNEESTLDVHYPILGESESWADIADQQ